MTLARLFPDISFDSAAAKASPIDLLLAQKALDACPMCEGLSRCYLGTNGWAPVPDLVAAQAYRQPAFRWKRCNCLKARDNQHQAEHWLGTKFSERSFDTFEVTPDNQYAFTVAQEYAKKLGPHTSTGLLFMGPVGVGKTHLAAAILKAAFRKGLSGAMVAVPQLLSEIRQRFSMPEAMPLEAKVSEVFFLVLDDLGAEKTTDWVHEELYLLLNARYERELPTVITTNCIGDELQKKLGQRVADRLREMCQPVPIGGKSRRRLDKTPIEKSN